MPNESNQRNALLLLPRLRFQTPSSGTKSERIRIDESRTIYTQKRYHDAELFLDTMFEV